MFVEVISDDCELKDFCYEGWFIGSVFNPAHVYMEYTDVKLSSRSFWMWPHGDENHGHLGREELKIMCFTNTCFLILVIGICANIKEPSSLLHGYFLTHVITNNSASTLVQTFLKCRY